MIPVRLQKEPADFDAKVRKLGNAWLLAAMFVPILPSISNLRPGRNP